MAKYPSQLQDKFNLRLPDGMKDIIAERAKANGRSMNSEIIQILQDVIDRDSNPNVGVSDNTDKWLDGLRAFMAFKRGEKGETLLTMDLDKLKELDNKK
ncbi:Arc family DNA-binding protein [Providencia rettgeri]|uniref:Arc family DNA-binding protein n=1 Tax=Providencia rettgeri TaxID=587 RepID=UPI001B374114|nr:Arc family DNA-binding protein [Providencia rettgeri]MBQ0531942.1 Arc family DNA-binding protein [Providencia rettgeri]